MWIPFLVGKIKGNRSRSHPPHSMREEKLFQQHKTKTIEENSIRFCVLNVCIQNAHKRCDFNSHYHVCCEFDCFGTKANLNIFLPQSRTNVFEMQTITKTQNIENFSERFYICICVCVCESECAFVINYLIFSLKRTKKREKKNDIIIGNK